MRRIVFVLVCLMVVGDAPLAAQKETPPVTVTWTGLAQVQFTTTSVDEERLGDPDAEVARSTFDMRRVRLGANAEIGDWITGTIGADFAGGRVKLTDVWMGFEVADDVVLRAGQFKKPFSMLELTSSSRVLPIERGVSIREAAAALEEDTEGDPNRLPRFDGGVLLGEHYFMLSELGYLSRDLGASVQLRRGAMGFEAGLFNGTGGARDSNDGKSAAARVTVAPSTNLPLVIGGGVSHREVRADDVDVDGTAFEVDAEWGSARAAGLHVQLEAAAGDNLIGGSMRGAQGVIALFFPVEGRVEGMGPVFRASWGDPRTRVEGDEAWFVTPGFNVYFHGRNRVMVNWEHYMPQGDEALESVSGLRVQAQLHF